MHVSQQNAPPPRGIVRAVFSAIHAADDIANRWSLLALEGESVLWFVSELLSVDALREQGDPMGEHQANLPDCGYLLIRRQIRYE